MKKVKYLLGLSIVGLGLLFNQSFGDELFVDGNFITPVNSTTNQYSSYLYDFISIDINGFDDNYVNGSFGGLGYQLIYDNSTHFSGIPNCVWWQNASSLSFGDLNGVSFNNSVLSFSPFNWFGAWTSDSNYRCTANSIYGGPIKYLLGYSDTSIGKNFIYLGTYINTGSVKYGIGDGFAGSVSGFYDEFSTSDSNYLRILYRSSVSTNINSFNSFDPVNLSGSEDFNNGDFLREIYYPKGTRNNYGHVIDDGYYYTKYKHFGGFELGYSYTFDKFQFVTGMNRDSLGFRTVSDLIEIYQKLYGFLPYSEFSSYTDPTSSSNSYNYSRNGILTLKPNSYYSLGNGNGVYLLSKNPNNTKQILYEHWSCELFNIDSMIRGTNNCVKLDGGYLTYNGNTEVLPFESKSSVYDFTSLNTDYPLLYDLFGDSSNSHGYTKFGNNCIYINQDERCYGFQSNSSVNITEIYLNQSNPSGEPGESYDINSYFSIYYQCMGPFYNTPDGLPPEFCLDTSGNLIDIENYRNCFLQPSIYSGEEYNHIFCDVGGYQQEMIWTSSGAGGYFSACYGEHCGTSFYVGPDSLSYISGFSLSTGLIEDMFTNLTGWVGKCPFPYTDFQLGKNNGITRYLKTLGFEYDPFVFINCVVAGFHHGRHTIDNTLFGDTFEHPLMYGDTPKHRSLFVFLDFIVILGLFGLLAFIKKIF